MSFGYIGDTSTSVKQQVKNKGILTTQESFDLERQGFLGGSLEFITETTFSGVSTIDFLSIKEDEYDVHFLTVTNTIMSGGDSSMGIQFYENGVLESGNVYHYAMVFGEATGTVDASKDDNRNNIFLNIGNYGSGTNDNGNAFAYLYNLGNSSKYSFLTTRGILEDGGVAKMSFGGGLLPQSSKVDGFRLLETITGKTVSGTAKLYGVKDI
tara:strand:+ start:2420 stop:3052 length:633 start_codon:yes stop_codon:yes gene_type:complete